MLRTPTERPLLSRGLIASALLISLSMVAGCTVDVNDPEELGQYHDALTAQEQLGQQLFFGATFGGNGRTCATCHSGSNGTVTVAEAQARFAANPNDPLFASIDSDDGVGNSFNNLLNDVVIRVEITLPPNVHLADDPGATEVVLFRGIPTTNNTPALEPILMYDGRAPNLQAQALDAVHSHFQPTVEPTAAELDAIAAFQKTLFTSDELRDFATAGQTGEPPHLPQGNTPQEAMGRGLFHENCMICHDGPNLNQSFQFKDSRPLTRNGRFFAITGGVPGGGLGSGRANASVFINPTSPIRQWIFDLPDGTHKTITSPDPGQALITGRVQDSNAFKIPSLWGISQTAPYFHDNHAKTLREVVEHYQEWFILLGLNAPGPMTDAEMDAITAYIALL
jgi:di-heme cytochrome c peroxidase